MTSENQIGLFDAPVSEPKPAATPQKSPADAEKTKPGLFLLDGMALVYRAFYALQQARMSTRDGVPTGAVFGFATSLLRIIEEYRPDYLAVAFDSPEKPFAMKSTRRTKPTAPPRRTTSSTSSTISGN